MEFSFIQGAKAFFEDVERKEKELARKDEELARKDEELKRTEIQLQESLVQQHELFGRIIAEKDAELTNTNKRLREVTDTAEEHEFEAANLRKALNVKTRKLRQLRGKANALQMEFVERKPVMGKLYSDEIQCQIAGVKLDHMNKLLHDGRFTCWALKCWILERWNIDAKGLQVKMFTDKGCIIAPSKHIGTGRDIDLDEVDEKLESLDHWVFVDIRKAPAISYVFKTGEQVKTFVDARPASKNKGVITASEFQKIVEAK